MKNSFADIISKGVESLKATTEFDQCISDIVRQVMENSLPVADAVALFRAVDLQKSVDVDAGNSIVDTLWLAGTQVMLW